MVFELRVDLGTGDSRVEAIYHDGVLRFVYRHEGQIDRNELRRRFPGASSRTRSL